MKMADVAVLAELKFRDGLRQKICVQIENNLSSLIRGVKELNTNVSQLLSELVEREKARGDRAVGELPGGNCYISRVIVVVQTRDLAKITCKFILRVSCLLFR